MEENGQTARTESHKRGKKNKNKQKVFFCIGLKMFFDRSDAGTAQNWGQRCLPWRSPTI